MSTTIYDIPVRRIDGTETSLGEFKGDVMVVVNVASKCGLTPQYDGLEKLYEKYKGQGMVVAGFPANDFGAQEPGTNEEIASFCKLTFDVAFPLFEKITVVGADKHPLYKALTEAQPVATSTAEIPMREKLKGYGATPNPEPEILWNFEKFVVGRDGSVVARFSPDTTPDDAAFITAVEAALATD